MQNKFVKKLKPSSELLDAARKRAENEKTFVSKKEKKADNFSFTIV